MRHLLEFVDHLLLLRGCAPIRTFDLNLEASDVTEGFYPRLNLWFQHAIQSQVRVFKLTFGYPGYDHSQVYQLPDQQLVSRHLVDLVLDCTALELKDNFLDFSSCTALKKLKLHGCYLRSSKISSDSLECLRLSSCWFEDKDGSRSRIHTPSLISLILVIGDTCATPILERMPSLEDAYVSIDQNTKDHCFDCGSLGCSNCQGIIDGSNNSILMEGLSEARSLKLIAEDETFIFKMDLKHFPTFSNLKTLLLRDVLGVAINLDVLTCFLKNSPLLEKLTLQMGYYGRVELEGCYFPRRTSAETSEHLKIVKLKCDAINMRVAEVLTLLCTFNISFTEASTASPVYYWY